MTTQSLISKTVELLQAAVISPAARLFNPAEQTLWVSYLGAAVLAGCFYLWSRRTRASSLKGLLLYLWPSKLLKHPSFKLDLKMYVFSGVYLTLQTGLVFGGVHAFGPVLASLLTQALGTGAWADQPTPLWAQLAAPVWLYLALELGYWLSHYMMHKIDWMWEFHKVHHSAEVMTPLVEWRQHPLEFLWVPLVMGVTSAIATAPILWLFGENFRYLALWTPNLILLGFVLTILHLRHSHVKLNATGIWGYIFQSPAHHQIHHSTDPRHFDKNLGFCLSVWDWAFGTLYRPKADEALNFGVYNDHGGKDELMTSTSLRQHFSLPLMRIASLLRAKTARRAEMAPVQAHPTAPPTSPQQLKQ